MKVKVNPWLNDLDYSEVMSDVTHTEKLGYLTPRQQVENLIQAGERLRAIRMSEVDEDLDTADYSGADIYQDTFDVADNIQENHYNSVITQDNIKNKEDKVDEVSQVTKTDTQKENSETEKISD